MSIKFNCACGRKLTAPDGTAGKKAKCPVCHNVMRIPDSAGEDAPVEAQLADGPETAAPKLPPSRATESAKDGEGFKRLVSHLEKRSGQRTVTTSGSALIVDDDPDILETLSAMLEHHGFEVFVASDGETAIKMAYEHNPSVIVLDVMLPGMNGFEVCRRLKDPGTKGNEGYDVRTPIMILTAKTKGRDVQYAKSVGADAYVRKPFKPLALYEKIDKLINK